MTTVRPPDYYVELSIGRKAFDALKGIFLDVSLAIEGEEDPCECMLAIPEGGREDGDSKSCEGWLWTEDCREVDSGAEFELTVIRACDLNITPQECRSLLPYLKTRLRGRIS